VKLPTVMDLSSFPNYPTPPTPQATSRADKTKPTISPRAARIFRDLALLIAIGALFYWARQTAKTFEHPPAAPLPDPPLEFRLIEERFNNVKMFASRQQVAELLGTPSPPRDYGTWRADLRQWEERAKHSHRHLGIPSDQSWELWTDSRDERKGVAILFADAKVYYRAKKGF
jgi:hypothetical protein